MIAARSKRGADEEIAAGGALDGVRSKEMRVDGRMQFGVHRIA